MAYLYRHDAFTEDFDVERILGHHQLPSDVADLTIRLYTLSFYVHDVFMSLITNSTGERILLKVHLKVSSSLMFLWFNLRTGNCRLNLKINM